MGSLVFRSSLPTHPRVVAIIQARMGSTRLPGKVLMPIGQQPLLGYMLERLEAASTLDQIVVATTMEPEDQGIVNFCQQQGVSTYCGERDDVLKRYLGAARTHYANVIVRLTADCPLIDPLIVDQVVEYYLQHADAYDYVSNTHERAFPRGMDVEVFSFDSLMHAEQEATDAEEREHVTLHFYRHPERFRLGQFAYRLTVDTSEDLELVQRIVERLYPQNPLFSWLDILRLLREQPEWIEHNTHIKQKKVTTS